MNRLLLFLILFLSIQRVEGQVQVITQPLNQFIKCCYDTGYIDVFQNSIDDFNITSYASPVDPQYFYSKIVSSNVQLAPPLIFGLTFSNYSDSVFIAGGALCYWDTIPWAPNTGFKYEGFRIINAPNDTTYGWVKLNFIGQQFFCQDTILAIELVYNTFPNVPLFAGQTSSIGFEEISQPNLLEVNSNAMNGIISIKNHSSKIISGAIYNAIGQLKMNYSVNADEILNLDISSWSKGIYFLNSSSPYRAIGILR